MLLCFRLPLIVALPPILTSLRIISSVLGPDEGDEIIEVKETTHEAFSSMIAYIYKPPGDEFTLTDISCPQKIFELLAIADRYEILNTMVPWMPLGACQ